MAEAQPAQEVSLSLDPEGVIDYQLKLQKFQSVSSLLLHFPSNFHPDSPDVSTRIHWLHLKGQASGDRRAEIVNVVYEAVARPADHPVRDSEQMSRGID